MRVLFYLPVVTPWWFEHIVTPILRKIATVAEVHVLAPTSWRNTGVGPEQLAHCLDLEEVNWQIIDSPDPATLRTKSGDAAELVAHVRGLAPDLVLCRTADFETARKFPGTVRFLMEGSAAPFHFDASTTITDQPFVNGAMPELGASDRASLDSLIAPLWAEMRTHWQRAIPDRGAVFRQAGIPEDRPMLLLPLEYEHEENFFLQHRVPQVSNRALVTKTAKQLAGKCTLVVTDHPLNARHLDRRGLRDTIAQLGKRVILAEPTILGFPATLTLAVHADGMLLGDSKSFGMAAAFGVPILRRSRFTSASWLNAETDLGRFVAAARSGEARAPSEEDTRLWFAYHFANEAFYSPDPDLTGSELIDRALRPVNPERWEAGIGRIRAVKPEYLH
ncbi:hypothetical protein [Sphingosinithalassobacter sp. CS137]|uniref:hypothetical protein n=1 Tax=Sphingosinithalassobacter sp. CS137 TaxID=2762748 RepID=UPI00165DFD3F|nr:hypothetical protein [Sphingosinithalassobacter sp. CS137]